MKEMLLLEKEREEAQAKEALLAVSMQEDKKKLLDDLTKENAKIEAAVKDLQKLKDQEKAELLNNLHGGKILLIINLFSCPTSIVIQLILKQKIRISLYNKKYIRLQHKFSLRILCNKVTCISRSFCKCLSEYNVTLIFNRGQIVATKYAEKGNAQNRKTIYKIYVLFHFLFLHSNGFSWLNIKYTF